MARPKGSKNKPIKDAKPKKFIVPWRFRNDKRFELGDYIVHKFLDARLIEKDCYKSYISAFKLVTKFPSKIFWQNLPCNSKIKSISSLLFGKAFERLTMFWRMYQNNLARDKKIKVDTAPTIEYTLDESINLEENKEITHRPKTILEFCK